MATRRWFVQFLVGTTAVLHGCGSGERTVGVTGKLVKNGTKYEIPNGQSLQMTFIAMEIEGADGKMVPNSDPYPVEYQADTGVFKVPGREGYGVPPGKYRVAISQTMTSEAASKQKGRKRVHREDDLLKFKFSESASPIIREIKSAAELTIDLDKPQE
ncbi:MAG: hypothetical protein KGM43_01310 [Planctomycetota bacterium]|nr:hypothetical protein [Planctomycetota bacterium]